MMSSRIPGANILGRYSTGNQHEDSIEVQVEKCTEYCRAKGITVLDVYADYAISGMKKTRPEYDRLMRDLRDGKGNMVVVYDQSRVFRDMVLWFQFRQELAEMGVQVVSVTQPTIGGDLLDPMNFMSEATMSIFNQIHVLQTRQKTVEKLRYMARHGQHTGGKPALGYKVQNGVLVVDEAEARIVRRIFLEYASGKTYREIIAGLNADGLRTKRGGAFGTNSLHDLLSNERYIGTLIYGAHAKHKSPHGEERQDAIRIPNALPAIIDKDLFARVQLKMTENRRTQAGAPQTVRNYPLKGKVFCGECGCAMCVRRSMKNYYYYACSDSRRTRQCDNPQIRIDKLEKTVADYIRTILGSTDMRETAIAAIQEEAGKVTAGGAARLIALQEQAWKVETQITRCVDAITAGAFSPALSDRLKDLEQQKRQLELQTSSLKHIVDAASLPIDQLEQIFARIESALPGDSSAVLDAVTRVEVAKDEIRIYTLYDPNNPTKRISFDDADILLTIPGNAGGSPKIPNAPAFGIFTYSLFTFHYSLIAHSGFLESNR